MGLAQVAGAVTAGVESVSVSVEVELAAGLPAVGIIGLADTAVGEARWRLRSAFNAHALEWPQSRVTIGLSPADLPKRGTSLDLAMAVGIVQAQGAIDVNVTQGVLMFGELGLDGSVRHVRGGVAAAVAARRSGCRLMIAAPTAAREAAAIPGIRVAAATSLAHCLAMLRGDAPIADVQPAGEPVRWTDRDFSDVRGHALAKFGCEIAAAGGHQMALIGSPGVGKTMLAERMITILPELTPEQSIDVTTIASLAGQLPGGHGLVVQAPFQAPHHSASATAMLGTIRSGAPVPGILTLAHHGVLFLDEAPEFARPALEGLRQPLESGWVSIARAGMTARLPARVQLVLAANPCPCGFRNAAGKVCQCSSLDLRRYAGRLSGPLMDRMDVRLQVAKPSDIELRAPSESSATIAERVVVARERAAHRLRETLWRTNSAVPGSVLRARFAPDDAGVVMLRRFESTGMSLRGCDRVLRMAWTICDLRGGTQPTGDDLATALAFRGDANVW